MVRVMKCIQDCKLDIWDGSGETVAVSRGDILELSYHEFDGSIGLLPKEGRELFCASGDVRKFEEVV